MSRILAYVRASSSKQDVDHQELEIHRFAAKEKMTIDEFITVKVSSRKDPVQRRINELMEKLDGCDTLLITEISRLGRSTSEIIQLINEIINKGIRLIAIKQNLDLRKTDIQSKIMVTLLSLFSELERDLISIRTKEALASKKEKGIKLGKPKGTIQKSKFDDHKDQIIQWLKDGVSIRRISKNLGCNSHIGLNNYIRSRKIKDLI